MPGAATHVGWSILRLPAWPFTSLLSWTSGCELSQAVTENGHVDVSLVEQQRSLLGERLAAHFADERVREALQLASPDLYEAMTCPDRKPAAIARLRGAQVRYWSRMAGRPTPFGLFATVTAVPMGSVTTLTPGRSSEARRRSRVDMEVVRRIVAALEREPAIRARIGFRVASTAYVAGETLRWFESNEGQSGLVHTVAEAQLTPELEKVLSMAQDYCLIDELSRGLIDAPSEEASAVEFIGQLIDSSLLQSELAPPLTTPDPLRYVRDLLARRVGGHPRVERLSAALCGLEALDSASDLRAIASAKSEVAACLPSELLPGNWIQIDLYRPPAPDASIAEGIAAEVLEAVTFASEITSDPGEEEISDFYRRFTERYGDAEVPFMDALDPERGVGFGAAGKDYESAKWLADLRLTPKMKERTPLSSSQMQMLRLATSALWNGHDEIELTRENMPVNDSRKGPVLPDSFAVFASVLASSRAAWLSGDYRIAVRDPHGPPAALAVARFSHLHPDVERLVTRLVEQEQAAERDGVLAEIVCQPQGRVGNVLARPRLRRYEIEVMGAGVARDADRIPVNDLRISASGGQFILYSARLGIRIHPRLTNAHAFMNEGNVSHYRFLASLQYQDGAVRGWSWGPLRSMPFLPRIRYKRVVLSPATWRMTDEERGTLRSLRGVRQLEWVLGWRRRWRVPRHVLIGQGDAVVPVDFENLFSVDMFIHLLKKQDSQYITESPQATGHRIADDGADEWFHEVLIPFVSRSTSRPGSVRATRKPVTARPLGAKGRSQIPGGPWLYVKFYGGAATLERLLSSVLDPLVASLRRRGLIDQWFFIRYLDPEYHLRVRFRGEPGRLWTDGLRLLHDAAEESVLRGDVWRFQLDTYDPELARYGGSGAILLAEELFCADSDAVLSYLRHGGAQQNQLDKWELALLGSDRLTSDFGLSAEERLAFFRRCRSAFASELGLTSFAEADLSQSYRRQRARVSALLAGSLAEMSVPEDIFATRSCVVRRLADQLFELERAGQLTVPVHDMLASFLHMHINRVLRRSSRQQELVIYDYLERTYASTVARARLSKQEAT